MIVLVVMEEGLPPATVVAVADVLEADSAVVVDQDAISMMFELQSNVQGAKKNYCELIHQFEIS